MSVFFDQTVTESRRPLKIDRIAFDFDQRLLITRRTAWNWAWMDGLHCRRRFGFMDAVGVDGNVFSIEEEG